MRAVEAREPQAPGLENAREVTVVARRREERTRDVVPGRREDHDGGLGLFREAHGPAARDAFRLEARIGREYEARRDPGPSAEAHLAIVSIGGVLTPHTTEFATIGR